MNAMVYRPSGEPIGKFEITGVEDLSPRLEEFLASGVRTPLHSYVEGAGTTWTIVGMKPVRLREGNVAGRLVKSQKARSRQLEKEELKEIRESMVTGLCLCLGGIVFTILSYIFAVNTPGMTHYLFASGAIYWGGFRFLKNFAKLSRAKLSGK
jgi:hypothetical protein